MIFKIKNYAPSNCMLHNSHNFTEVYALQMRQVFRNCAQCIGSSLCLGHARFEAQMTQIAHPGPLVQRQVVLTKLKPRKVQLAQVRSTSIDQRPQFDGLKIVVVRYKKINILKGQIIF